MDTPVSNNHTAGKNNKNGTSAGPAELRDAWGDVTSSMNDLYRAADTFATEQTRMRPHVVLGVAAGVGFVLGGGLASRLGSTLLGMGTRLVASRFLEELTASK
jgi:hypothetical protein